MNLLREKQHLAEKSPLHDEFLYVTTLGRQTSEKYIVKLRFIPWKENSVCVLTSFNSKGAPDWLQNVISNESQSEIVSRSFSGGITEASIPLDENNSVVTRSALENFVKKYGESILREMSFYKNSRPVLLEFLAKAPSNDETLQRLEFDFQARDYTSLILENPISRWEREVTVQHVSSIFRKGQTVLEIGCGTGIETIPLASLGLNIVAIDISEKMLELLSKRSVGAGVDSFVKTRHLSSFEIEKLRSDSLYPSGGFDGVFSNFGAMNLEKDLRSLSRKLGELLKARSYAVFTVWNKFCLSEILAGSIKGGASQFRARSSGLVKADSLSRYSLDTFTYTPSEFADYFVQDFELVSWFALPTLIPPPEYARRAALLLKLKKADLVLSRLPFFRNVGDNFVLTLRKK